MAMNMEYVKYENSYLALRQIMEDIQNVRNLEKYLNDEDKVSAREKRYAEKLYEECKDYIDAFYEAFGEEEVDDY